MRLARVRLQPLAGAESVPLFSPHMKANPYVFQASQAVLISSLLLGLAWPQVLYCSLASNLPLGDSNLESLPVTGQLVNTTLTMVEQHNGSRDETSKDM
jgi:hypothetical protein